MVIVTCIFFSATSPLAFIPNPTILSVSAQYTTNIFNAPTPTPSPKPTSTHTHTRAQPVWSAFRKGQYGFGVLEVANATHAHWMWHEDPRPLFAPPTDSVWIVRER